MIFKFIEMDAGPSHRRIVVRVGNQDGDLALAGAFIMRTGEWLEMKNLLKLGAGTATPPMSDVLFEQHHSVKE